MSHATLKPLYHSTTMALESEKFIGKENFSSLIITREVFSSIVRYQMRLQYYLIINSFSVFIYYHSEPTR